MRWIKQENWWNLKNGINWLLHSRNFYARESEPNKIKFQFYFWLEWVSPCCGAESNWLNWAEAERKRNETNAARCKQRMGGSNKANHFFQSIHKFVELMKKWIVFVNGAANSSFPQSTSINSLLSIQTKKFVWLRRELNWLVDLLKEEIL